MCSLVGAQDGRPGVRAVAHAVTVSLLVGAGYGERVIVDPALTVSWLILSATLSAIPGPSVVLATSRAMTSGRPPAMRVVAGNFLGGQVLVLVVVAGLGAVLAASATLFTVVKWAGAAGLVWLGVRAIATALRGGAVEHHEVDGHAGDDLRAGFITGVSNPKSVVGLGAMLPQFVDPHLGLVALQLLVLGVLGGIAQVVIESAWVLLAARLRPWFLAVPRRLHALHAAGGAMMIAFAVRLGLSRPAT